MPYLLLIVECFHQKHLHKHQSNGNDGSRCSDINIDRCPIHHLQQIQMFKIIMQECPNYNSSYNFISLWKNKSWIEFSEPVQSHDIRPSRLLKNEVSPVAEVVDHYIELYTLLVLKCQKTGSQPRDLLQTFKTKTHFNCYRTKRQKFLARKEKKDWKICEFHYIVYFVTDVEKQAIHKRVNETKCIFPPSFRQTYFG